MDYEHEDVLEAVQRRLDLNPGAMRQRRETVEHPFGTIKMRMGATHFLMNTLPKVTGGMALHVLAYNLTLGAEHPGHPAADGRPQGIGAGLCSCHQACDTPDPRFIDDGSFYSIDD